MNFHFFNSLHKKRVSTKISYQLLLVSLLLFSSTIGYAQKGNLFYSSRKPTKIAKAPDTRSTELGVFGGVSFYNGEVNPSKQLPIGLMNGATGLMLRRNINSRWAFRVNGLWGKVRGDDSRGTGTQQLRRNFVFSSHIYELSGQFEFNFIPYCSANKKLYFTPYLFWGFGGFYFNPISNSTGEKVLLAKNSFDAKSYSRVSANMPFGFGIKGKLSHRISLGLEWGIRKTWTDFIDDVSTVYANEKIGRRIQRGNSQNKDFYTFTGGIISIRIGPSPNKCESWGQRK